MKKIFLATTAIAALGVAGTASASEWSAGVNGYMQIGVGFAENQDGVGVLRDGEIHFNAKMTADNGLTFKARVELEATTNSDQIDENWASVGGSFGTIKVGGDDSAKGAYNNGVIYAPGARVGYYDAFGIASTNVMQGISGNSDSVGIHYDSPSFMGFRVGASYQPRAGVDGGSDAGGGPVFEANGAGDNAISIGAAYSGNFGDAGFGISAAFQDADQTSSTWHVAGNVSFSGFKVAGGYEDDGGSNNDEFYIGASYSNGPWTIAGGFADHDGPGDSVAAGWVSYAVAPGVSATVGVESHDNGPDSEFAGLGYLQMNF